MTDEIAKQISKLYQQKSDLLADLSVLANRGDTKFHIETTQGCGSMVGGVYHSTLRSSSIESINNKVREYTESLIKCELVEVDKQLSNIQCQ